MDGETEKVEVVRDHRVIHATPRARFTYVDQSGKREKASYYYLRITQKDGMQAWSSPVWVAWR